jgi:hypothetical protein
MADMVVFVVRAGVSPSGGVLRSLDQLRGVAGVVFNRVNAGAFRRYYHYAHLPSTADSTSPAGPDAQASKILTQDLERNSPQVTSP